MIAMPRSSTPARRKTPTEREREDARTELRARVGAFVRARREQLGLSQGDIITVLGYVSRNSVSNIETGREGLPAKRIYAWADVLEVPRDGFFRFVTGENKRMDMNGRREEGGSGEGGSKVSSGETELISSFRKLPGKYQRRVREAIKEFSALSRGSPKDR